MDGCFGDFVLGPDLWFHYFARNKLEKKPGEIVNLAERIQDQLTTEALAKLGNCNTHLKEIGRVPWKNILHLKF